MFPRSAGARLYHGRTSLLQVDRQEAKHTAEQRRLQIERANKILFDESDRVKTFHSTLQKSDTIQENELLIGYKKQINVLKQAQEAAFVEQQKQALEVRVLPMRGVSGINEHLAIYLAHPCGVSGIHKHLAIYLAHPCGYTC